jgi:predicted nucleic-acid-binding protein
MTFIDTNIVLRWLLNDHPTLSSRARQLVAKATPRDLLITDVVLAEIYYVLCAQKQLSNNQVAKIFTVLQQQAAFAFEHESHLSLLFTIVGDTKLDFADCYLVSRAISFTQPLRTFDTAMQKAYDKYKTAS